MTLHQLRLFLAVSKHLNVTQASQELHISQPAVSRQLRQLEDACGGKLYTVGPRGIELTANGRLLLSGAEQIISQVEKVKSALSGGRESVVLRVGECGSFVLSSLPLLWASFRKLHPATQIAIRSAGSRAIERMVLGAEIEVAAVTSRSFHPLLRYENLRSEKLVFFTSNKHPLAKKKSPSRRTYPGCPS